MPPPLAEQRRTVLVAPVEGALEAMAAAYASEGRALAEGDATGMLLPFVSSRGEALEVRLSPRLRCIALHGARCAHCGMHPYWAVIKRLKGGSARLLLVDDPRRLGAVELGADHVVPRSAGGPSDLGNLVPLCSRCNVRKGSRPTHVVEHRWRVRDLMEASVPRAADPPLATRLYEDFRRDSFLSPLGRAASTYAAGDAGRFLRWASMGAMDGEECGAALGRLRPLPWPGALLDAFDDPWLEACGRSLQAALARREARVPPMPPTPSA